MIGLSENGLRVSLDELYRKLKFSEIERKPTLIETERIIKLLEE
jgi:hypothetical protein